MKIDVKEILARMLTAAKDIFTDSWKDVKPYVENEFKAYTQNLLLINKLKLENKIDEEQARLYLEIQKSSMRTILLSIQGISIITLENAINAAIDIIKDTVNTAIGWRIL